jgi:hypothetical protein
VNVETNIVGTLELNDKVEVTDPTEVGDNKMVAIRVLQTKTNVPTNQTVYVSDQYLSVEQVDIEIPAPRPPTPPQDAAGGQEGVGLPPPHHANPPVNPGAAAGVGSKVTVIINVATATARIYTQCETGESCHNKLIFQTDVIDGEDKDETRTNLGVYRVNDWTKFYEVVGTYPAWYKPGYPKLPDPGDRLGWFDSSVMPGGVGEVRGAFGWFKATVGPNPDGQWFHGTIGWGKDGNEFIEFKYTFWGELLHWFTQLDSHGCTRFDNPSIAYARTIVPIGARYMKIYAKEAILDKTLAGYSKTQPTFDYVITNTNPQSINANDLPTRDWVLAKGTPQTDWLDQGSLNINQYPSFGKHGTDSYALGDSAFHGVFYIDDGTLEDYQHPVADKIHYGGYMDNGKPAAIPSQNTIVNAQVIEAPAATPAPSPTPDDENQ